MKTIIPLVKERAPLIHHLTNDVVVNFTANGLLAFGAAPIMAKEITEVEEIAYLADGLLLNIGTATEEEVDAMIVAGQAANIKGIPVVLDPVGVTASIFRQQAVREILRDVEITAMKGNAGEIAYLAGLSLASRGVDSADHSLSEMVTAAEKAAQKLRTMVIMTGKQDVITAKGKTIINETGDPLLTKITGAGCLLGSIISAALASQQKDSQTDPIQYVAAAVQFYGRAAEVARNHSAVSGPGTFVSHFLDALQGEFL